MPTIFKSMGELTEYLEKLETRIQSLEEENERLRAAPQARDNLPGNAIVRYVSRSLPGTSLLSPSFFKHAFAVWGHFFVAKSDHQSLFLCPVCLLDDGDIWVNLWEPDPKPTVEERPEGSTKIIKPSQEPTFGTVCNIIKELILVSWNDREPKYDLRDRSADWGKIGIPA